MKYIYSFVWAAICAWMFVWLLGQWNVSQWSGISNVVDWINGFGISAKTVLFIATFLIFWITGIHKIVGHVFLQIIGWTVLIVCVGLVILCGYAFLSWLISLL